ncbi:hypothetical protein GCM10028818_59970 [Spirosoma horti]
MEDQVQATAPDENGDEISIHKKAADKFTKDVIDFIAQQRLALKTLSAFRSDAHTLRAHAGRLQGLYIQKFGSQESQLRKFFTENLDHNKNFPLFDANRLEHEIFASMANEATNPDDVYRRIELAAGWFVLLAY